MAAVTPIKGKVFIQIGDGELVEFGTLEIPVNFTACTDKHHDGEPKCWCTSCRLNVLGSTYPTPK